MWLCHNLGPLGTCLCHKLLPAQAEVAQALSWARRRRGDLPVSTRVGGHKG